MKTKTHSSLGIHEHLLTIVRKLPRDFESFGRREHDGADWQRKRSMLQRVAWVAEM